MIDIHCHMLPNVDDGSSCLKESIEMAKIAEKQGIKKIIMTPHYHPEFKTTTKGSELKAVYEEFKNKLKENRIDIEIYLGNEIYFTPDLLENISQLEFFSLNDSKYILMEFPPSNFPNNLCDIVYELKLKGLTPVLAHVERYMEIHQDPEIIYDCIKSGAIIQVNASSLEGKKGKELQKFCNSLLDRNMIHLVATDAHSSERRRPLLRDAYCYIENKYSKELADDLFINNGQAIIDNRDINVKEPCKKSKAKKGILNRIFRR